MRETLEREIKLLPGEGFEMPALGEIRPPRAFVTTYHDTADLRLLRHGVTLRHRVEDGVGAWQVKLPRGAARLELESLGPPTQPPAGMLELLVAHLAGRQLVPVTRMRTHRETRVVDGAEIVDDTVAVMEGISVVRRFRELEVELVGGDESTLASLRDALVLAGATVAAVPAKIYRALGVTPTASAGSALAADTPPADALGVSLELEYLRLLAHDPGARRGDDPEDLHQLRVACRRLRAFLRVGRRLVDDEWSRPLRAELRWLGSALGPARDLDVMLERVRWDVRALGADGTEVAGFLAGLEAERTLTYSTVVVTLESVRYLDLVGRLEGVAAPPLSGSSEALGTSWRREVKRMRRTFARLGDDPCDADLHAARISVKRSRYAAELAAHELGDPGAAFVVAAKELQDVLGDHQDACVYEAKVRQWLAVEPAGAFAAGRLVERARRRRARCRRDWRTAWKRLLRARREVPA
jgi:CHAD domain-containing protein